MKKTAKNIQLIPLCMALVMLLFTISCSMTPKPAIGLPSVHHLQQRSISNLNTQYQVELLYYNKSTSFLLLQELKKDYLNMVALTLTGQLLFELQLKDHKVALVQSVPEISDAPLDYLIRDILWATLDKDILAETFRENDFSLLEKDNIREIYQAQELLLKIKYSSANVITVDNLQTKYQLVLTLFNG